METTNKTPNRVRVVYVSIFSGVDFLGLGWERNGVLTAFSCEKNIHAALMNAARCKDPDGSPVIEIIEISKEEYKSGKERLDEKGNKDMADNVAKVEGKFLRSKTIQEIQGDQIREGIEQKYGKDVKIVLLGGPPCQDFTKLNTGNKKGRNVLIFEYLRILRGLQPDISIMEQVTDITAPKHSEIWNEFKRQACSMKYQFATLEMNALNYGGSQFRQRIICQWVANYIGKKPLYPKPNNENAKRAGEIVDLDYFFSGTLSDSIKTKNHYMCCITSGSPKWFSKKIGDRFIERAPTIDELLLFQGARPGEIIIPEYIPLSQVRKVIGNGVEVNLSELLAKTIIEGVLELKHVGDGWFIPIDAPDDGSNIDPSPMDGVPPVIDEAPGDSVKPSEFERNIIANQPDKEKTTLPPSPIPALPIEFKKPVKIISSGQLASMQFETLNFEGKWNTLLGNPSVNFNCIIHGLSGHGKSTFAIQFAKYLADNFGIVLYISGEEGFSKTLQDKLINTNSESPNLDMAELKTHLDILRDVQPEKYRFIFIDSLDNMKINPAIMKSIRIKYKTTAFITISQSTKGGEIRGSYQLVHDADIVIHVEDGLAQTTKNRFKERGTTFNVFEKMSDEESVTDNSTERAGILQPKKSKESLSKEDLEILLKEAIANEDYVEAAKLRDAINNLKSK